MVFFQSLRNVHEKMHTHLVVMSPYSSTSFVVMIRSILSENLGTGFLAAGEIGDLAVTLLCRCCNMLISSSLVFMSSTSTGEPLLLLLLLVLLTRRANGSLELLSLRTGEDSGDDDNDDDGGKMVSESLLERDLGLDGRTFSR